ncbi:hypothetical protein CIB95_07085 [Lottiidibacillus patelloidae]|uniref:ABC-2 type transporter transmembrane domain-containing protein n=1 Tax=Lottiidibacillus patelloidae TaxID=2670334 RepID=A0A263BTZ7_9BACI|nr:ABC transporter permease [Lottiidibacillus patelloidae]OZM57221.1 hypothetical protein CIB95_07085 [Lottiidibacillus patelloidae]
MKNTLLAILTHRFKILVSTWRQLLLLISFACLALIIAYVITVQDSTITKIPIAIVDLDQTEYSELVVNRLENKPSLNIIEKGTKDSALELIKADEIEAIYTFKKGFMDNLENGNNENLVSLIRGPSAISVGLVNEIVASEVNRLSTNVASAEYVIAKYEQYELNTYEELWQDAWENTDQQWEPVPLLTMDYEEIGAYSKQDLEVISHNNSTNKLVFIVGLLSTMLMLYVFIQNQSLINEKNNGTLLRLTFTAIKPQTYFLICAITLLLISFLLLAPVSIYLLLAYQIQIHIFIKIILASLLYIFCFITISLCITTLLRSLKLYHLMMVLLAISFTIFGGTFFKLSDLSNRFASLAYFTPQHWYLSIIRNILANQSFEVYLLPTVVLTSICLIFTIVTFFSLEVKHD